MTARWKPKLRPIPPRPEDEALNAPYPEYYEHERRPESERHDLGRRVPLVGKLDFTKVEPVTHASDDSKACDFAPGEARSDNPTCWRCRWRLGLE